VFRHDEPGGHSHKAVHEKTSGWKTNALLTYNCRSSESVS
jgi:hypothetical protein